MDYAVVVLAAGEGTRMRSRRPKVLHQVAGQSMVECVVEAAAALRADQTVVVVGHGGEEVRKTLGHRMLYAEQDEQSGTGHAVRQARKALKGTADAVIVLYGDMPLVTTDLLRQLVDHHAETAPALTMVSCHLDDPTGYGRVIRDESGAVEGIVEEAAASASQKRITEVNSGIYCFEAGWLWTRLNRIQMSTTGEYYLTDLIAMAADERRPVEALVVEDPSEVLGVNNRVQLAEAEAVVRDGIRQKLMLSGVTMIDPASTFIDHGVEVGQDTVIYPGTTIEGLTRIGAECKIGPNTRIRDSEIGDRCQIRESVIEAAVLEDSVNVGPFSHLRRGARLGPGVHIGNFGEIKASHVGARSKMGHFSYLGDATVGEDVNIGAGTITCNYDGESKHPTVIEDGAFVGSDSMLVAPVRIGARSRTGAGSVVTRDVPPGALAYGVPARVKRRQDEAEISGNE